MLNINGNLTHFANPKAETDCLYPEKLKEIISVAKSIEPIETIKTWPGYSVTPFYSLASLASTAEIQQIWYKDESQRFGLKSFKALGGAYAVARQLQIALQDSIGTFPSIK
jgi:diaminopropionate ammonia-lyase